MSDKELIERIKSKYMRVLHFHDTQAEIHLIEIQSLPKVIALVREHDKHEGIYKEVYSEGLELGLKLGQDKVKAEAIAAVENEMKNTWWNFKGEDYVDSTTPRIITFGALRKAIKQLRDKA